MKDTWRPLLAIMVGIVVNLLGAFLLTNFFSHYYDWKPILDQVFVQIAQANGDGVLSVLKSFLKDIFKWSPTRGESDLAVGGLALSLSLAYFFQMIVSGYMLNKKKKVLSWEETIYPSLLKLLNTLIMIVGMYLVFRLFDFQLDTSRTVYVLILTIVTSIYGGVSYLIGSKIFSPKEFAKAESLIKGILIRLKLKEK